MTYLLIALGLALFVLVAALVFKGVDDDEIGVAISDIRRIDTERRRRLAKLNEAYELAKSELGEEPTIDQILLTRDTMEDVDGTS